MIFQATTDEAITWPNADLLLVGPLNTNVTEIHLWHNSE